ncbi:hypothetical protein ALC57_14738 [Trachymyrmex cornetzi]|uniref:Uncharacterized protein n=1 Tax=Trachymyrmex cornetzi TaxID=471704 RepID=A0A195DJM7_9HYME|nr:hypothetical protein ALC57_14738 [Trachymyrmex cornetzi]
MPSVMYEPPIRIRGWNDRLPRENTGENREHTERRRERFTASQRSIPDTEVTERGGSRTSAPARTRLLARLLARKRCKRQTGRKVRASLIAFISYTEML